MHFLCTISLYFLDNFSLVCKIRIKIIENGLNQTEQNKMYLVIYIKQITIIGECILLNFMRTLNMNIY